MRVISLISFILCLQQTIVCAQQRDTIHFILLDNDNGKPIEDAFIFIENTTIGTSTDQNGKAALETAGLSAFNVVITHINYENYNTRRDLLKSDNVIRLDKRVLNLELITVKSKKLGKKKRKKWMKRFEKAFLGEKISKKKVKILNPEVIWFEEKNEMLYAYAVDNIKIKNDVIGYEMQVALDHFSLAKSEDVRYEAKVFYNDIIDKQKKKEKLEETRNSSFLNSRQLFYKALVFDHPILEKQFDFGKTSVESDGDLVYQKMSHDELDWRRSLTEDVLFIDSLEYLTVIKKEVITKSYDRKNGPSGSYNIRPATSFLKSRTGQFIFNKQGELLNKTDIEESGYWTNFRMAKELPVEYVGSIAITKQQNVTVSKLVNYEVNYSPEKLYVHIDKHIYFPYENIWFKAYLLNAIDHTPSAQSDVIYIELLNPESEIIHSCILHKDIGFHGDYTWGPNLASGNYLLRAYTNYMRNDSSHYFFETSIEFRNPIDSVQSTNIEYTDSISINFYPEGGDLIDGLSSKVVVKAVNSKGHFVDITGQLINRAGEPIAEYESMHKGMGLMNFIPRVDSTYYFKTVYQNRESILELPTVIPSGLSLQINPTERDHIFVDIAASDTSRLKDSYLVGHVRGSIFAYITDLEKLQFKLAKSTIPTGIVHFTLFDNEDRPQAERLVFNEYGYEEVLLQEKDSMQLQQNSQYSLKVDSTLLNEALDLSVSVIQIKETVDHNRQADIKSYLLLQSDLDKEIPYINQYLSKLDKSNLFYLDLYMRSSFWTRFRWKDLPKDEDSELEFHAEKNFSLRGYTSKANQEDGVQSKIMLNTIENDILYDQQITSKDGKFMFLDIPLQDSTDIYLQARLGDNLNVPSDEEVNIKGNRLVDIHLESFNTERLKKKQGYFTEQQNMLELDDDELKAVSDYFFLKQRQDTTLWQIGLEAVEISRSRRTDTYNGTGALKYVNFDEANWIAPETHGVQLINKVAPTLRFLKGAEAKLVLITFNLRGEVIYVPMQVIIDGVGYNPEGSNASRFFAMPADNIQSMTVAGNAILVTTRDIPRSTEAYLKSGILTVKHPGYARAREFSKESTTVNPVISTLYWDPKIDLSDIGEIIIPMESISLQSTSKLIIQGVSQSGKIVSYVKRVGSE